MTSANHYINLNCPNFGGKLDVYDDMERFACGYCGSEMLVNRRGGTVSLKTVTEAIRHVQIGTDKTAAELGAHPFGARSWRPRRSVGTITTETDWHPA